MSASNKIEFSYLNANLMVLTIHPHTLGSDSVILVTVDRKGGTTSCEQAMMTLMAT